MIVNPLNVFTFLTLLALHEMVIGLPSSTGQLTDLTNSPGAGDNFFYHTTMFSLAAMTCLFHFYRNWLYEIKSTPHLEFYTHLWIRMVQGFPSQRCFLWPLPNSLLFPTSCKGLTCIFSLSLHACIVLHDALLYCTAPHTWIISNSKPRNKSSSNIWPPLANIVALNVFNNYFADLGILVCSIAYASGIDDTI